MGRQADSAEIVVAMPQREHSIMAQVRAASMAVMQVPRTPEAHSAAEVAVERWELAAEGFTVAG
jgi:hypothetical protein